MGVLIIGESGFLGGTLARLAVKLGNRAWELSRGQRPVPLGVHAGRCDGQLAAGTGLAECAG